MDTKRETLLKQYRQLSEAEKILIQLYSVIYEPARVDDIKACWEYLPTAMIRQITTLSKLTTYIRKLHQLKLLVKKGQKYQCSDLVVEIIARELAKTHTFRHFSKAVSQGIPLPQHWRGGPMMRSYEQVIREARIGLYTRNDSYVDAVFNNSAISILGLEQTHLDVLLDIINNPFDTEWFKTALSERFQVMALHSLLAESILELINVDQILILLEELVDRNPSHFDFVFLLVSQLIFRGQFSEAQVLCDVMEDGSLKRSYLGCLAFMQGDTKMAFCQFQDSLKQKKKETKSQAVSLEGIASVLCVLAGIKLRQGDSIEFAKQQLKSMIHQDHPFSDTFEMLEVVLQYQSGDLSQREAIRQFEVLPIAEGYSLDTLLMAIGWYWILPGETKQFLPLLDDVLDAAIAAHYDWFAVEVAHLLNHLNPDMGALTKIQGLPSATLIDPIVNIIQPVEPWELCLQALTTLNEPAQDAFPIGSSQRLIWLLSGDGNGWDLTPKEQKINAKGGWSKGRAIALKRLSQSHETLEFLTTQDHRICHCIETNDEDRYYYYSSVEYEWGQQAIAELVGHPLVFWEHAPDVKVEVVDGEPEILVKQTSQDSLLIELSPKIEAEQDTIVQKETLTRVKVIRVQPEHQRIATILGEHNGLKVPLEAKERVLEAINSISKLVTVHSDIGGGNESIEEVPSSAMPHLQLFPLNSGLNLKLLTRPFDAVGPYFAPGKGGSTVIADIEGTRTLTTRDLTMESQLAQTVIDSCSVLQDIPPENFEWILDEPEDCLDVLLSMQSLDDQVVIEWPEGEKFKLKPTLSLGNLNLSLMRQRNWFAVDGKVQIDPEQVLGLQQLMKLLGEAKGRFLPLGDGQFLALTDTFRKRLEELRAISEKHGKGMRLNPLASLALEDWMEDVGDLKTDQHWKQHLKRLKEVRTLEPKLPSTLQAELRDYQIDGFQWLARLSEWGVGACLADDMGLGKTLQAIAVILTRAPQGPALVIAPTSVGMNWMSEAQKFAPTLNPLQFGSGDGRQSLLEQRQTLVDALKPFDLLVCTYGLLQQAEVAKMLAEVEWQVIVLDEAQAIKNASTKRSKAAMKLQAEFKILTTGTPIENHLGELWNLFRFITPGLLGSSDQFNQRFAHPIERDDNPVARQQLKKLIQPFILRRTKTQVLDELPSRTEIPLYVDLSQEEQALYEALRQNAIQNLANKDSEAGTKHLQVLAEIMKLRRCCCNPELVVPPEALPGICSKLNLFGKVLEELLSNNHKALVFSQFVDHLSILRKYLDDHQIVYQYLDGSTTAKQRKVRVDAFQAGEGDVFLISLKAGGTGLNLTAADYVIHMDPWWNPAVEDQASDRAHRIGQKRPVTIYRLITRNTIEEKIVDLHGQKRDLADSLLEGSDMSGKISTDELLRLIHQ